MHRIFLFLLFFSCGAWAGTLTGTTRLNSEPIGNVTIELYDTELVCLVTRGFSDDLGNFNFLVDDGDYFVRLRGLQFLDRYHGNQGMRTLQDAEPVTIVGGTVRDFAVRLAGSIAGVVSIEGEPSTVIDLHLMDVVHPFDPHLSGLESKLRMRVGTDGSYRFDGLEPGCYIVGMGYKQGTFPLAEPITFYPGTTDILAAVPITVAEGQTVENTNFSLDPDTLGALSVTLPDEDFSSIPSLVVQRSSGQQLFYRLNDTGSTDVQLPADSYKVLIGLPDPFLPQDGGTYLVNPGQVTEVNTVAERGGTIKGTVNYEQNTFSTSFAFVEVYNADAPSAAAAGFFKSSLFLTTDPGPFNYELSGIPDGDYVVRITQSPSPLNGPNAFARSYYTTSPDLNSADRISISNGSIVEGIDFTPVEGAAIEGRLFYQEKALVSEPTFLYAVEKNTDEYYFTVYAPPLPYKFSGLAPGEYYIGTYFADKKPGLVPTSPNTCENAAPSYYPGVRSLDDAVTITVAEGQSKLDMDFELFRGGGLSIALGGEDCDCPAQTGVARLYREGELVTFEGNFDGFFEIYGMEPGDYTLEIGVTNPAPNGYNTYTYPETITIQEGEFQQLDPWCLASTRLMYSWVSNRADQFESIVVANNYGDTAVTATLTARRANGESQTVTRPIPARGFLREAASSLFPSLGDGPGYTVVLEAPSTSIRGGWVTNNLNSQSGRSPSQGVAVQMSEGRANTRTGKELLFGYLPVTQDFNSAPVIVNIGNGPTTVLLAFYDNAGAKVGETTLANLEPNLPFATTANNLVAGDSDVYLIATSDREPITGVGFTFNNLGETAIGNVTGIFGQETDGGPRTLLFPWISNRSGSFQSVLAINNRGQSEATVTLTARRRGGEPVQTERTIPAGGFLQEEASSLFPSLDGAGYSVEMAVPTAKIQGQWVTNNLEAASGASPSQGIAVDISDPQRLGSSILFGYLPVTDTFISAPVVVNLGNQATDIELYFFDQDGNELARDTTTLAGARPKEPFAAVVNTLVPDGKDVYMIARSSDGSPITGVGFVFNGDAEPAIGNATAIPFTPPN